MYEEYKNKILSFYEAHNRMPGYSEIMSLVGFKSKNAVYKLINKLVEEGVIQKDSKGRISPSQSWSALPLLGLVEAGFPSLAEQTSLDSINLDEFLIENRGSTYMLEVKGESMIDAGIQEGDLVIAEKGKVPRIGDIVIAQVDGDWTMKYYRKKGEKAYLEPANKAFKNIYPERELIIAAVVKGVIRKY